MKKPPLLTDAQKQQLHDVEPALRAAAAAGDYAKAKMLTGEIQKILRPTGHETRLMQAKNCYFEAAFATGHIEEAAVGFIGVRGKTGKHTRVYLEATALLALCHIRRGHLTEAEPLIAEVLRNDKYIRNPERRRVFHGLLIQRFDEEGALSALIGRGTDDLDSDKVHEEAIRLLQTKSDDEIFIHIAEHVPREVADFILKIDQLSRKQLTTNDLKYLQPPLDLVRKGIEMFCDRFHPGGIMEAR